MKFYDGFAVVKSLGWLSLGEPERTSNPRRPQRQVLVFSGHLPMINPSFDVWLVCALVTGISKQAVL
jgi:hypothetical protein